MDQLAGFTEKARKLALERFRLIQRHSESDEAGAPIGTFRLAADSESLQELVITAVKIVNCQA